MKLKGFNIDPIDSGKLPQESRLIGQQPEKKNKYLGLLLSNVDSGRLLIWRLKLLYALLKCRQLILPGLYRFRKLRLQFLYCCRMFALRLKSIARRL